MSVPEPLNPNIPSAARLARRLAQRFTPNTPLHHPLLDPNVPKEDFHMVPPALFAGRRLNWQLPKPAKANLHVMLKLKNEPDELMKEFHEKIPQIDEALGLWSDVKRTSPTTTGEAQLRARAPIDEDRDWTFTEEGTGSTFNLVSALDTPARADVIYLTDAAEDSGEHAEDSIPSNLRTIEWLGFDGSYVHLEDAEPKKTAFPTEQGSDIDEHSMRRNNTPSNLRTTDWLNDGQYSDLSGDTYNPEADSDGASTASDVGLYESFWIGHR